MKAEENFHPAMPQELQRLIKNAQNAITELQSYIDEGNHQKLEDIHPELYCAFTFTCMYQAVESDGSIKSKIRTIRAMNVSDFRLTLMKGFRELID